MRSTLATITSPGRTGPTPEMGDERIVPWERIAHRGEPLQHRADVPDALVGDHAEAVVVKSADFHGGLF